MSSAHYWPFKQVLKLARGDTGDNTYLAIGEHKLLYIRGRLSPTPNSVLASKIATIISPEHFSSERLLDNHLIGSRKLPGYAVSTADPNTRDRRKEFIEQQNGVFPGTGIIDEVTNFVVESDFNIENFGFSDSDNITQGYLTKIDFDHCSLTTNSSLGRQDTYDYNILSGLGISLYHAAPHVSNNNDYLIEKLYARMKLCLFTTELFENLAHKAYEDQTVEGLISEAVRKCCGQLVKAKDALWEMENLTSLLEDNPSLLNQCYTEIVEYVRSHFDSSEAAIIEASIDASCVLLHKKLKTVTDSIDDIQKIDMLTRARFGFGASGPLPKPSKSERLAQTSSSLTDRVPSTLSDSDASMTEYSENESDTTTATSVDENDLEASTSSTKTDKVGFLHWLRKLIINLRDILARLLSRIVSCFVRTTGQQKASAEYFQQEPVNRNALTVEHAPPTCTDSYTKRNSPANTQLKTDSQFGHTSTNSIR